VDLPATGIRISIAPLTALSEDENAGFLNDLIQRSENALKFYEWIKLQTKNKPPVPQTAVKVFLRNSQSNDRLYNTKSLDVLEFVLIDCSVLFLF
jgi:hypothetical protein